MEKMGYDLPEQEKQQFSQFLDQVPPAWLDPRTNTKWYVSGANIHKAQYILCTEDGEIRSHLSAEEIWRTLEPLDIDQRDQME
jgi:hypothetical protein